MSRRARAGGTPTGRWSTVAALVTGLLLAAVTGCGIPEHSEVEVAHKGPSRGSGSFDGRSRESPTRTASGSDPKSFVTNYLAAVAGEPEGAYERAKRFIALEGQGRLPEKQGSEVAINVVRLTDDPVVTTNSDQTISVRILVQQVGLLRANGVLAPPVATETEYQLRLRNAATSAESSDAGLFVSEPPTVLLLSVDALEQYYLTRNAYFWSSDHTRLVPDQRYLPLSVPDERRVTEVVKWLTGGPVEWLAPAVARLPDRTTLINNATRTDGRWEVNLDMSGEDDTKLDRLATQLAWSLAELSGQVELKIRNQTRRTIDDTEAYRRDNQAYPLTVAPQRFCVYDQAVHPLSLSSDPGEQVPVVPEANRGILSAALSRAGDETLAAFVVQAPNERQRLRVGTGREIVQVFRQSAETFASVGRPVWLKTSDPRRAAGLVVADGRLYSFNSDAELAPVAFGASGRLASMGVSLDGRRIAVVAGGVLYVAALSPDGEVLAVGPPRRLATSLTELSAVDWSGENSLVLAGAAEQQVVYEISVDGAAEIALKNDVGAKVTHLSAYPGEAVVPLTGGSVMYEANGVAWADSPFVTIQRSQVQGVTPPTGGAGQSNPTAPFFLY